MPDFTFLQTTSSYSIALVIFCLIILAYWGGYRVRKNIIQKDPERSKSDLKTINGMLIGLLGLLLAFTFSMANSRFDDRRRLVSEEANIIGTTILRTDMYPDSVRKLLRSALKDYVERRIAFYEAGTDFDKAYSEYRNGQNIGATVWHVASEYAKKNGDMTRTSQLIPSINEMLDIVETRRAAGEGTIPDSIMYFLFLLAISLAFLLGYDQEGKVDWIVVTTFAFTLSATIFSIVDLDRPRSGLINMDGPSRSIVALREMFNEQN
jgi:hypothetical protein